MSEFRKLQAKLQKIEESYFSNLDLELQELRRANLKLSADQLVRLARDQYGQEAATYLSDQLESEADYADYKASDPQPHMVDENDREHPSKEQTREMTADEIHEIGEEMGLTRNDANTALVRAVGREKMGIKGLYVIAPSGEKLGPFDSLKEVSVDEIDPATGEKFRVLASKLLYVWDVTYEGARNIFQKFIDEEQTQKYKDAEYDWIDKWPGESIEEELFPGADESHAKVAAFAEKEWGPLGFKRNSNWPAGTVLVANGDLRKQARMKFRAEGWVKEYPEDKRDPWWKSPNSSFTSAVDYEHGRTLVTSMLPYGSKIEEAVVEVPAELRGDTEMTGKATSDDAAEFMGDLGIDDEVSDDVVDPETGELLFQPGQTKRAEMKKGAHVILNRDDFTRGVKLRQPILHTDLGGDFEDQHEAAWELLDELRNSDFYNVVWRDAADSVDDPEEMMRNDYDVYVDVPVLLKRKDGARLVDADHDNIKEIVKAVKAASTMGNVGIGYAGTTDEGTTAHFYPTFF